MRTQESNSALAVARNLASSPFFFFSQEAVSSASVGAVAPNPAHIMDDSLTLNLLGHGGCETRIFS